MTVYLILHIQSDKYCLLCTYHCIITK